MLFGGQQHFDTQAALFWVPPPEEQPEYGTLCLILGE